MFSEFLGAAMGGIQIASSFMEQGKANSAKERAKGMFMEDVPGVSRAILEASNTSKRKSKNAQLGTTGALVLDQLKNFTSAGIKGSGAPGATDLFVRMTSKASNEALSTIGQDEKFYFDKHVGLAEKMQDIDFLQYTLEERTLKEKRALELMEYAQGNANFANLLSSGSDNLMNSMISLDSGVQSDITNENVGGMRHIK